MSSINDINPILPAKRVLFVGMPSTGKTSFLAALQHYVDADISSKEWRQYQYASDTEYLNRIHHRWLSCEEQPRTVLEQTAPSRVEIYLEEIASGEKLVLNVPDVEGEIFSQQWEERTWSNQYEELVTAASGILLFINPSTVIMPVLLTGIDALYNEFISDEDSEVKDWAPNLAPTQVAIVDILEVHKSYINKEIIPISIIISAWDTVLIDSPHTSPEEWLALTLPLLHQYLTANDNHLPTKIFGISAQGGDFSQQAILEKLRQLDQPAERVIVQEGTSISNNISAPVHWILKTWKHHLA